MEPELAAGFVFAALAFVVMPLVFVLLHHQRKMAELIHSKSKDVQPQIQATDPLLLQEIMRLRDTIAQQAIAIDNLSASQKSLEAKVGQPEELRQRLG